MGLYDTVSRLNLQIKCIAHDEPTMKHYNIGDEIPLQDGVCICYGGWFTVNSGKVRDAGKEIFTKYGGKLDGDEIISALNPVFIVLNGIK